MTETVIEPRYNVVNRDADDCEYDPHANAADTPDHLLDDLDKPLAGVDELPIGTSLVIDGPPGTGKSLNLRGRALLQAQRDDLGPEDIGYGTFRRSLALELLRKCKESGIIGAKDMRKPTSGRTQNFGSLHAIALRNIDDIDGLVETKHKRDFCEQVGVDWKTAGAEDAPGELLFGVFSWLLSNQKGIDSAGECPHYEDLMRAWPRNNPNLEMLWKDWVEYKDDPESRSEDYQSDGRLWDFDELFVFAIQNGITPDVELLIIDELHDVYPLMFEMVEMWMEDTLERGGTVLVAGDPLQVVNQHQGASPEFFREVSEDLPTLELRQSFRVPRSHWNAATRVLNQSYDVPDVQPREKTGELVVRDAPSWEYDGDTPAGAGTPGDIVADNWEYVTRTHDTDDAATTAILFLARTRGQLELIGQALREQGYVFRGSDGSGGWSWDDSERRCALFNALNKLRRFDADDWTQEVYGPEYVGEGNHHARTRLTGVEAKHLIECVDESYWTSYEGALGEAKERATEDNDMPWEWPIKEFARYATEDVWSDLTNGVDSLDALDIPDEMHDWLYPALVRETMPLPSDQRDFASHVNIELQSVHASKGNEALCTVLYDGISRRVRRGYSERADARRNEHRVWYVGLTRATERLVVVQDAFNWTTDYIAPLIRGGDSQ